MKKIKHIAILLVLTLIVNCIPAYAYDNGCEQSKFGINYAEMTAQENGDRKFSVSFDEENADKIKNTKIYTKVVNGYYDYKTDKYKETQVDGPVCSLNTKDGSSFIGTIEESHIKNFGEYKVDKIEIYLKDGSKKISFNKEFYSDLSNNDKENGELKYYDSLGTEEFPLSISNGNLDSKTVKLGESKKCTFDVKSTNKNVTAKKIYVTFSMEDSSTNRSQTVEAYKVKDSQYAAELKLTNSLDAGTWHITNIKIIDNLDRECSVSSNMTNSFKVVSENTDIEGPKLKNITISSNVYDYENPEEKIKFTIEAEDDNSGLRYADIDFIDKDGKNQDVGYCSSFLDNGKYVVEPENFKNGTYYVKSVRLTDKAGNNTYYIDPKYKEEYMTDYVEHDFSGLEFEVKNKKEEDKDFQIQPQEVTNDKTSVTNGNDVKFNITLKSNRKINYVTAYFENENNKSCSFHSWYNDYGPDENGNWGPIENKDGIYNLEFSDDSEEKKYIQSGKYTIKYIYVSYNDKNDKSQHMYIYDDRYKSEYDNGNEKKQTYDFSKLDFKCDNKNEDITAPEITDITLDKPIIQPGDKVEVRVKVKDDKSGFVGEYSSISSYINYKNVQGGMWSSEFDKDKNEFVFTVEIPSYYSTGIYRIDSIDIRDVADNYKYYNWHGYNEDKDQIEKNRQLLSKGTILVKKDLKEALPPTITANIEDGDTKKAPFTPIVTSDHGKVEMTLNGKQYKGEPINAIGNYSLFITATGLDGSQTTKQISFRIIGEINDDTKPQDIAEQIKASDGNNIEIQVSGENKTIDKTVFEAIKGTDKTVSFTQEDGTVWTFDGKDINDDNIKSIESINISVNSKPEEEAKDNIDAMDSDARYIHFDYHGALPGKAAVKVKVDNPEELKGKDLTFYYFNPETKKAEKVQGPLSIDNDGFVTVEITHCSDYFLSTNANLDKSAEKENINLTVDKTDVTLTEGETAKINAKVSPEDTKLSYSSSNKDVASVDEKGEIKAVSKGTAVITVKAGTVTKEIKVTVKEKQQNVVKTDIGDNGKTDNKIDNHQTDNKTKTDDKSQIDDKKQQNDKKQQEVKTKPSNDIKSTKKNVTDNNTKATEKAHSDGKDKKSKLPQTGSPVSSIIILLFASVLLAAGIKLFRRKQNI